MEKNPQPKCGFNDQKAFVAVGESGPALIVAIVDGCLALLSFFEYIGIDPIYGSQVGKAYVGENLNLLKLVGRLYL